MIAKRTPRLAAAFAAAALVLGVLATGGTAAHAAPAPGTGANGGTLTLLPGVNPAAVGTNVEYPRFRTSGGCPADADAYQVFVTGPGLFATQVDPIVVIGNSSESVSSSAAFESTLAENSILDLQHALGGATSTNPAGEYDFTLRCIDSFLQDVKATFTGAAYFGTPGTYTDTPTGPNVKTAAKISGTAKVGGTVTCAASFGNAGSVAYSWLKGSTAVGSGSKLVLSSSLYNQSIACKATATNAFGTATSTSSAAKVAIGAKAIMKKRPTISGIAKVKKTLTCNPGTWSLPKVTFSYQWKRGGKNITGSAAHKQKYKVVAKDKGKKLTCTVTVKKAGYASATATTAAKTVAKK